MMEAMKSSYFLKLEPLCGGEGRREIGEITCKPR